MDKPRRREMDEAAKKILGYAVYDGLVSCRISDPKIWSMAGEAAFLYDLKGEEIEILRAGLLCLSRGEYFLDEEER